MTAAVPEPRPYLERRRLVGRNIRLARKLAGMHQEHLATLIGKRRNHVSEWELGYHEPHPDTLDRIAGATEQPLDFFYRDHSNGE